MTRIPGARFLHLPGPTHIPEEVLNAMHRQPMDHGDPQLDHAIAAIDAGIKRLLQTKDSDLFMFASNGHGAWKATIENLLAPGQAVLIPGTGHFSESWAVQAEALGRRVIRTPFREGYPIDANDLEQALRADAKREIAARHAMLARAVHAAVECWSSEAAVTFHCRVPGAHSESDISAT